MPQEYTGSLTEFEKWPLHEKLSNIPGIEEKEKMHVAVEVPRHRKSAPFGRQYV